MAKPEFSADNVEVHFQEAPGSGTAAILAFLHITLCGVLAYGSYYLFRYANEALLASPHLSWQFFLPMGLALALYLPTNPLSRVLAVSAAGFGILGLLATGTAVTLVLTTPARQFDEITTALMATRLVTGLGSAAVVSVCVRLLFVRALPSRHAASQ